MSLATTLVSKSQITKAVTLMSINAYAARFAGPLMADPNLAFGEASLAFLATAALYSLMIIVLLFLRIVDKFRNLIEWRSSRHEFSIGVRFTTLHPVVGPLI